MWGYESGYGRSRMFLMSIQIVSYLRLLTIAMNGLKESTPLNV